MTSNDQGSSFLKNFVIFSPSLGVVVGAGISWWLLHLHVDVIKPIFIVILSYIAIPIFLASIIAFSCSLLFPLEHNRSFTLQVALSAMITYWIFYWLVYELLKYPGRLDVEYIGFSMLWYCAMFLPVGLLLALILVLIIKLGSSMKVKRDVSDFVIK